MKLTDLLDQIDRLELEIYPGPWVANDRGIGYEITTQHQIDEAAEVNGWPMPINSGIKDTFPRSDAEFIALARTALPKLSKALRTVLDVCAAMERGVGYRKSGDHDTWDSYHEGKHDMAMDIEEIITETLGDFDASCLVPPIRHLVPPTTHLGPQTKERTPWPEIEPAQNKPDLGLSLKSRHI